MFDRFNYSYAKTICTPYLNYRYYFDKRSLNDVRPKIDFSIKLLDFVCQIT